MDNTVKTLEFIVRKFGQLSSNKKKSTFHKLVSGLDPQGPNLFTLVLVEINDILKKYEVLIAVYVFTLALILWSKVEDILCLFQINNK